MMSSNGLSTTGSGSFSFGGFLDFLGIARILDQRFVYNNRFPAIPRKAKAQRSASEIPR